MEKSAAYLLGFQQGLGGEIELEKAAQLLAYIDGEAVPEGHEKEAMRSLLKILKGILGSKKGLPGVLPKPVGKPVTGLNVHYQGGKPRNLDIRGYKSPALRGPGEGGAHPMMGGGRTRG